MGTLMSRRDTHRIPLNFFGMPFGIAGLAAVWHQMAEQGDAPAAVGDVLFLLSALVWLTVLAAYATSVASATTRLVDDLTDPVAGPFASLAVITPTLLAAQGLYPHAPTTGRVVVVIFMTLTVLAGGWYTGQWIYSPLTFDSLHPGYFLPTVAGGLVASAAAAGIGYTMLAHILFGLGMICWLVLGSLMIARLVVGPTFPQPLVPTIAIEVAPAAVASLTWFAINGGEIDVVAQLLGGYGLLMILAQLRLLPLFVRLPFMPSLWAFAFSWAAVATASLHWLERLRPVGHVVWAGLVCTVATVLIGGISLGTLVALRRGRLLPPPSVGEPLAPARPVGTT